MTFDARTLSDILTVIVGILAMAAILDDALAQSDGHRASPVQKNRDRE